jgi:hypothetical protein
VEVHEAPHSQRFAENLSEPQLPLDGYPSPDTALTGIGGSLAELGIGHRQIRRSIKLMVQKVIYLEPGFQVEPLA